MTLRTRSLSRTLVAATAAAAPVVVLAPTAQAAPSAPLPRSPLGTLPATPLPTAPAPTTPLPTVETSSTVTRWVSASVANVRSGPSTSYRVTGTKTAGSQVKGTISTNGWLKISDTQWMSPTVLTTTDPGGSAPSTGSVTQYVNVPIGNVRSGPSLSSSVIGSKTFGTKVTGTWTNGWLNMGNGQYMGGSILTSTNPAGEAPPADQGGTRVDRWVNVPIANVRSGPGLNYGVVGTETNGTKLTGTLTNNGWVNLGNGRYISETVVTGTAPSTPAPPADEGATRVDRWVNVPVANVRSGPGLNYGVVGTETNGTKLTGTLTNNGWVNLGNGRYISETVVTGTAPSTPAPPADEGATQVRRYVTAAVANVRSGPSTSYSVVGTRTHGTEVRGVLTSNGWLKMSDREFMSPGVLSSTPPGSRDDERPAPPAPAPTPGISPVRQAILDEAARHVGKPYVLYSEPDATFDCSSYTWWVYKQNGIDIPRTVRDQKAFVTRVTDPRPGDLIFYNNYYHVGIYSGPGMTYEALNPSAGVVHGKFWTNDIWYGRVSGLD